MATIATTTPPIVHFTSVLRPPADGPCLDDILLLGFEIGAELGEEPAAEDGDALGAEDGVVLGAEDSVEIGAEDGFKRGVEGGGELGVGRNLQATLYCAWQLNTLAGYFPPPECLGQYRWQ